jgi:hypothetical protein
VVYVYIYIFNILFPDRCDAMGCIGYILIHIIAASKNMLSFFFFHIFIRPFEIYSIDII